jgi:hypothetical protein
METEDDNDWDAIASKVARRINNGGYGMGYILDAKMPTKPAVTPLLVLENPEKLTKIRRQNVILFYVEPDNTKPETLLTYAWRAEDVLGQKGTLKIEREMDSINFPNTKKVLFRWIGDDSGSEWVDVDRVKDPHFVLDYIESSLNGKYSLPF